jgi:hypothetical protein
MNPMKASLFLLILLACSATFGQSPVKATIHLKDGKTVNVYHFGKLICESNRYSPTFTILRGIYSGNHTEVNDYSDISKLVFTGFTMPPAASVGNQKGKIMVVKKSGVSVPLEEAELSMSCFGPADRYNEIHVQIINPLTDKAVDMSVEMNKIESISF